MTQPDPTDRGERTYRGTTMEQRRALRRSQLIEAAFEVYGTTGYRTATVDRVCAAAGLTKRYFYEAFEDSEDLLLAAYAEAFAGWLVRLRAAATENAPDLAAMTRAALTTFFEEIKRDPRHARIVLFEILGVSPKVDSVYQSGTQRFVDMLLTLADVTLGPGRPPDSELRIISSGLVGAVTQIAVDWMLVDFRDQTEHVVDGAYRIITSVVGPYAVGKS